MHIGKYSFYNRTRSHYKDSKLCLRDMIANQPRTIFLSKYWKNENFTHMSKPQKCTFGNGSNKTTKLKLIQRKYITPFMW